MDNFDDINDFLAEHALTDEELDGLWPEWLGIAASYSSSPALIKPKEIRAIYWLGKISDNNPEQLIKLLKKIRSGESLYRKFYRLKKDGSKRVIHVPSPELKRVQDRINRNWLKNLSIGENAYGFSGGSTVNALEPHLKNQTMLRVDIKNAFPSITYHNVLFYFSHVINIYRPTHRKDGLGRYSWYFSRALSELVTWRGILPQGAPTSPRIFDLVCSSLDIVLSRLAKNVDGIYTRYADNIYFSMDCDPFPQKVRQAILKIIESSHKFSPSTRYGSKGRRRYGPNFKWHKLKVGRVEGRMLGLNIVESKLHNTRDFKRKLRKTVYHLNWMLTNGEQDIEKAVGKFYGMTGYAQMETLPDKLLLDAMATKAKLTI